MSPLSALSASTGRPAAAAAACPRFTRHALPSALHSPSSSATRMPVLLIQPLPPSNASILTSSRSSTLSCKYTSVPERMGEEEDNPSAAAPPTDPEEQSHLDDTRRQRDAADQQHATSMLQDIEAAAKQDSPEDAGHPEKHRALSSKDYPAPGMPGADSPTGSFLEPQIADGLPWLGINSSGININDSSISDDASLGNSPLSMLAAATTAATAADAAASAATAAAAAASAAADASTVGPEAGMGGRAVEGMQQVANEQQGRAASSGRQRDEAAAEYDNDNNSLLEPWCENP